MNKFDKKDDKRTTLYQRYFDDEGKFNTELQLTDWQDLNKAWAALYPPTSEQEADGKWTSLIPTGRDIKSPEPHFLSEEHINKVAGTTLSTAADDFFKWARTTSFPWDVDALQEAASKLQKDAELQSNAAVPAAKRKATTQANMTAVCFALSGINPQPLKAVEGESNKTTPPVPPGWVTWEELVPYNGKKMTASFRSTKTMYVGPVFENWQTWIAGKKLDKYPMKKAASVKMAWAIYMGWVPSDSACDGRGGDSKTKRSAPAASAPAPAPAAPVEPNTDAGSSDEDMLGNRLQAIREAARAKRAQPGSSETPPSKEPKRGSGDGQSESSSTPANNESQQEGSGQKSIQDVLLALVRMSEDMSEDE